MIRLKVRRFGSSLGVRIPAKVAKALGVGEGDALLLTKDLSGYRITACDPAFEKTMNVANRIIKRYRNALRELAD